jgi:hypothetical protein
MVSVISDAHAHVSLNVVRYSDGYGETQDGMGYSKGVDVAIVAEDLAGHPSCNQANPHEYRIGNVHETEQSRTQNNGSARRDQLLETKVEVGLQNELLKDCPDRVSEGMGSFPDNSKQRMQRASSPGKQHRGTRKRDRSRNHPQRGAQSAQPQSNFV